MGPYYDHHWQERQQRAPAADRDPLRSSRSAEDQALGTPASGWTVLAGMPVRALGTLWQTDGRRAWQLAAHPVDRP
jgi:hypothetical protein